jgi:hypothetical protein
MKFLGIPLQQPTSRDLGRAVILMSFLFMAGLYCIMKDSLSIYWLTPVWSGIAAIVFSMTYGCTPKNLGKSAFFVVPMFAVMAILVSGIPFAFF